ncbi:MAG: hypothetical protein LUO89_14960 [Methanothrix sp.]|nr:hypothetical protein [Methanothrix sp.]
MTYAISHLSSDFPRSPRTLKGAIVAIDEYNPLASVIVFQYNPETMTRTVTAKTTGDKSGARSEALRLSGAPEETIKLDVEIDATDQLEMLDQSAVTMGIHPQLSALEMILYPKSSLVLANAALLKQGTLQIVPPEAPLTLFIWGEKRILPVRLTNFTITEDEFDAKLNPIRAKVELNLRVLSYNDLPLEHIGWHMFISHQIQKEIMAVQGSLNNLTSVLGGNVRAL